MNKKVPYHVLEAINRRKKHAVLLEFYDNIIVDFCTNFISPTAGSALKRLIGVPCSVDKQEEIVLDILKKSGYDI